MDKLNVIKTGFTETGILESIPVEVLDPIEQELINEYKRQLTITDQPTLKSVAGEVLAEAADKGSSLQCIKAINDAEILEKAELDVKLWTLRLQAQMSIYKTIHTTEPDDKTLDRLLKRAAKLRESKESQWMKPVSASQWDKLEKVEEEEIELLVAWFRKNGVTIKKKVLYSFIATTNGGKTIIKTWFAYELIRTGSNVLYLAQEEPATDTVRRIHQAALGLTEEQYKELTSDTFETVGKRYAEYAQQNNFGEIFVAEWPNRRVGDIAEYISEWNENNEKPIDALVVDYGKLVEVTNAKKNAAEWERIGTIFSELKQLAMNENVAVITSIQLNREASKNLLESGRTPDLYDVAGAYEATHHANYIWAVRLQNKEDVDLANPKEVRGTYTLTVLKQKYGNLRHGDQANFQWYNTHYIEELEITPTSELLNVLNHV